MPSLGSIVCAHVKRSAVLSGAAAEKPPPSVHVADTHLGTAMNTFRHIRRPLLDGESVPPARSLYEQLVGIPAVPAIPEPDLDGQTAAEDEGEDEDDVATTHHT